MQNQTNFVDAIRKDLSERDPRTYAIIGALGVKRDSKDSTVYSSSNIIDLSFRKSAGTRTLNIHRTAPFTGPSNYIRTGLDPP